MPASISIEQPKVTNPVRLALLVVGVLCCSTAVIFIKFSHLPPTLLAAGRLLGAALMLSPLALRDGRRLLLGGTQLRPILLTSAVPGMVLGAHFISWIVAARMTDAVNSTLVVNLVPVVMPVFLFFVAGERMTRREFVATLVALLGLIVLAGRDASISAEHFRGDLLCFASMLLFTWYLVLARGRTKLSLWLYVVPLYAWAGVACLLTVPFDLALTPEPFGSVADWSRELLILVGLTLVPTVIGHSVLNSSMQHLRGQVVSLTNMGQVAGAGVLAYLLLGEVPSGTFYVASLLIVASAAAVIIQSLRHEAPTPDDEAEPVPQTTAEPVLKAASR